MTELSLSRQERRAVERRGHILDAAARLFSEKGFHRTTTKNIADAADVSEGTLYNYFKNKDDLLLGIMAQLDKAQHLSARLAGALPEDPGEFLQAILAQRRRFVDENSPMLQAVLSEILVNPELRTRYYQELVLPAVNNIERHLQARIDQGQLRPLDTAMTARVISGMTLGLYMLEVLGDRAIATHWDALTETVLTLMFQGARAEKNTDTQSIYRIPNDGPSAEAGKDSSP